MNSGAVAYADIFDYPLTAEETHRWWIPTGFDPEAKGDSFAKAKVSPYWIKTGKFYHLPGRSHLIALRRKRQRFSQLKWQKLQRITWIFWLIPWIKLVAVTGALSMNNSDRDDDIDLMIITAKNRLWLTRILLIILLFPFLRRGQKINNRLCLNLFLDEASLLIKSQNLYTAHEVCQIKPLFVRDNMYQQFITVNKWVSRFLPNALQGLSLFSKDSPLRSEGESLMDKLNSLFFRLQYSYMKSKITTEKVSRHFAFFHPRPTGEIILAKYQQRISKDSPLRSEGESLLDKKLILVTGCFDILHSEHRKLLRAAKNLGGELLVGIETDARVRKLKGPGRPFNPLKTRLKNVGQLGIADQVFALPEKFDTHEDYEKFIAALRPDILAVSESTPFMTNKKKLMPKYGGKVVVVLPHNPKISTTLLTNK